jgi:hypothetical protein
MELKDVEKERLLLKIDHEGGLEEYMDYGLSNALYMVFKNEFDAIYLLDEKISLKVRVRKTKKERQELINNLEFVILNYLNQRREQRKYTDDELDDVEYILDIY